MNDDEDVLDQNFNLPKPPEKTMAMHRERGLLRKRETRDANKVSFVELLFDLVFVFAVTQLSHGLIEHFSLIGIAQTALLMLAVWWVWIYTSWVTNWLDPEQLPVRLAMMLLMVLGLLMSAAIPKAFESRGLFFAGAYVSMQVGRTLFFLWAVRGHANLLRNFQRILVWLSLAGVLWIAGALHEGLSRLVLWALAMSLDVVSPSLGFRVPGLGRSTTSDWDVDGAHLSERCALFIIIALGESILVTGATLAGMDWNAPVVSAFFGSLIGSLAMWWLYFDASAEAGTHRISHSRDPGRLARLAYTYLHLIMVAGIIVVAVGDEFVLAHPLGHCDLRTTVTVLGGVALYLIGNAAFKAAIVGRPPASHGVGVLLLAALAPLAPQLSPVVLNGLATAVLVGIAVWDGWRCGDMSARAEASELK